MNLYGSLLSPFVRHCRIALIQSGLEWNMNEVDNDASAKASPSKKVPYFEGEDIFLTDSSSILKYIRNKSGKDFMADAQEYDLYCLANTLADSTLNLFLLEKDGLTPENSGYLKRQQSRVESGLDALNAAAVTEGDLNDAQLRIACYLDWALFRERIDIANHQALNDLLVHANTVAGFQETNPRNAA